MNRGVVKRNGYILTVEFSPGSGRLTIISADSASTLHQVFSGYGSVVTDAVDIAAFTAGIGLTMAVTAIFAIVAMTPEIIIIIPF